MSRFILVVGLILVASGADAAQKAPAATRPVAVRKAGAGGRGSRAKLGSPSARLRAAGKAARPKPFSTSIAGYLKVTKSAAFRKSIIAGAKRKLAASNGEASAALKEEGAEPTPRVNKLMREAGYDAKHAIDMTLVWAEDLMRDAMAGRVESETVADDIISDVIESQDGEAYEVALNKQFDSPTRAQAVEFTVNRVITAVNTRLTQQHRADLRSPAAP